MVILGHWEAVRLDRGYATVLKTWHLGVATRDGDSCDAVVADVKGFEKV